jgi:hypothetical protein
MAGCEGARRRGSGTSAAAEGSTAAPGPAPAAATDPAALAQTPADAPQAVKSCTVGSRIFRDHLVRQLR